MLNNAIQDSSLVGKNGCLISNRAMVQFHPVLLIQLMRSYHSGQLGQAVDLLCLTHFGGSNPSLRTIYANVAQIVEHSAEARGVGGAIPSVGTLEFLLGDRC